MKQILITGGAGFIGTNFVRYVLEHTSFAGPIVVADKLTYAGNLKNLSGLTHQFPNRFFFEQADIHNAAQMDTLFSRYQIDTVCHFAAESHVDRSIVHPDDFIQTNIVGTFTLLELARKYKTSLFHHVSTDEVYGSLGKTGLFAESMPYDPSSPYSASKAASDHLVRAYWRTYGVPVTISNCSNNYGPYQFPEKLIPLMLYNARHRKPLPVYGSGQNVRDWLYVTDHCRAIWVIMTRGRRGETYNIGGRCEKTNIEVVEAICDLVDREQNDDALFSTRDLIKYVKDRPGHDLRYAIDDTKLRTELGFEPEETFETGLQKTADWYQENAPWVEEIQTKAQQKEWLTQNYTNRI